MILTQKEIRRQLFALLECELGQEKIDQLMLSIQERLMSDKTQPFSSLQANKLMWGVYKKCTQDLRKEGLSILGRLDELYRERKWENPSTIERKEK